MRSRELSFVYMLASRRNGTLYTGVTSNLVGRVLQHKMSVHEGFTKTYEVHMLVWFEEHGDIREAIHREKQIKRWLRAWKIALIEANNPQWNDLFWKIVEPQAVAELQRAIRDSRPRR